MVGAGVPLAVVAGAFVGRVVAGMAVAPGGVVGGVLLSPVFCKVAEVVGRGRVLSLPPVPDDAVALAGAEVPTVEVLAVELAVEIAGPVRGAAELVLATDSGTWEGCAGLGVALGAGVGIVALLVPVAAAVTGVAEAGTAAVTVAR